ncbi:PREDICTED: uncharacterized protein LOC108363612 isoform X1 [Rhagoletis zephyria]|nr:PREDICTED: uncharacterized protein LOC108363612 isoform X1 [Rhagoletis zephyria]XP_017472502.1 PREDICTED: uncharacterized protein LOC108363612 isoform X1 [Rhagoletis zephyria]
MKIIFLFSLAVCVAVTTAMPSKMPTNYNENYPVLKADFKNLNPDNICLRLLMDLDNRIQNFMISHSFENVLSLLQSRCVLPKCDLKKLLWYMYAMNDNSSAATEDNWNVNKVKKNFDEIDKTSASFNTLNQLI